MVRLLVSSGFKAVKKNVLRTFYVLANFENAKLLILWRTQEDSNL